MDSTSEVESISSISGSIMLNRKSARRLARQITRWLPGMLAAIALVAVMSIILDPMRDSLSAPVIVLVYLFLVGALASASGWLAGLVAAIASAIAIDVLFIAPRLTFSITEKEDILLLLTFLTISMVSIPMLGRARANLREARARQDELTRLYELITALAGQRREINIARTLANRLQEALQAQAVEVMIQPDPKREAVVASAPAGAALDSRPIAVVPLMTPRGLLGEIHIWLTPEDDAAPGAALPISSDQLVRAAAGQAALAVERALLAEAETRAQVLEESDHMKTVLLSSVSHELRTPLATIKASVSSLRSGAVRWDTAARQDLLAAVEEETDHLNQLVGNLLEMSRIESGALKPSRQWNVLADILDQTLRRLRRASARHRMEIDVSEDLPLVPVDDAQIGQVFANLIGNSLKFAPPGTSIAIRARVRDDRTLLVTVANQGPQVPEDDLQRIFDKFHRVTAADQITGTGLGLSICKGIVEAHGGHIWAENLSIPPDVPGTPGNYYTFAFHLTLPLALDGTRQPKLPPDEEYATPHPVAEPTNQPHAQPDSHSRH